MFHRQVQPPPSGALAGRFLAHRVVILALSVALLALSACWTSMGGACSPTATFTPVPHTATGQAVPQATTTTTVSGYLIKGYFSKFPGSLQNAEAVFAVNRISPAIAVATFSIQSLLTGPTPDERSVSDFSGLNSILTGPSFRNGPYPTGDRISSSP
jgi:hypothetical protein